MTLEEAIKHAEEVAESCQLKAYDIERNDYKDLEECAAEHRQLVEWLRELKNLKERSLSDDEISRQAAIIQLSHNKIGDDDCDVVIQKDIETIKALPSVKPQPKTGHWILANEQNKEDVENDNYRFICSECQCSDIHAKGTIAPYCWKCGAMMIEPQESEGQE